MTIHYITPFSTEKNIGKEYNDRISELPDDCYIVLRDGDTMFLTSDWGSHIKEIIEANPKYHIISCVTNRVGLRTHVIDGMFDEENISKHIQKAIDIKSNEVIDTNLAPGYLMIFHKSVWDKVKFMENSIAFDTQFSLQARELGYKVGLAIGFYLLHLYRWGKQDPKGYHNHLL